MTWYPGLFLGKGILSLKVPELCKAFFMVLFSLFFGEKMELVAGACNPGKMEALTEEMLQHNQQLARIGQLSNACMLVYGHYKRSWLCKAP
jgi:hypothetical protein